ncbi:IS701 family transposase [Kribbella sp. CA-294648]|uniref:IS701 family transposase n=1 Tax=Kribbella sp. CA-294648 TaxID=3239948 RepID=UPI003D8DF354
MTTTSLSCFTDELFRRLPRADQRRWAEVYVRGLLTTPGKKTVRRMAAAVTESGTAAEALHQFVNVSPWDWEPVQAGLMRWVEQQTRPRSWVVAAAVIPKRGEQSCGVHRRFLPRAGRTVNCQIGIGAFLSSATGELPVAWTMLLPAEWSDATRRRRARIPGPAVPPAGSVLDLLDSLTPPGATPTMPAGSLPVVADLIGYLDTRALIHGLVERGHDFVLAVPDNLPLQPDLKRTYRLFDQRRAGRPWHDGRWLTNLTNRPFGELLALIDGSTGSATAIARMEQEFGLRDFEGRSYPGWHHHMTLASAAYAYQQVATYQAPQVDRYAA